MKEIADGRISSTASSVNGKLTIVRIHRTAHVQCNSHTIQGRKHSLNTRSQLFITSFPHPIPNIINTPVSSVRRSKDNVLNSAHQKRKDIKKTFPSSFNNTPIQPKKRIQRQAVTLVQGKSPREGTQCMHTVAHHHHPTFLIKKVSKRHR